MCFIDSSYRHSSTEIWLKMFKKNILIWINKGVILYIIRFLNSKTIWFNIKWFTVADWLQYNIWMLRLKLSNDHLCMFNAWLQKMWICTSSLLYRITKKKKKKRKTDQKKKSNKQTLLSLTCFYWNRRKVFVTNYLIISF